jgi:hypothetical protein
MEFPVVVKESTGFDIIPINTDNEYDRNLISNMSKKLLSSLKMIERTGVRFEGTRINEIGRQLEPYFVRDLNTAPLEGIYTKNNLCSLHVLLQTYLVIDSSGNLVLECFLDGL